MRKTKKETKMPHPVYNYIYIFYIWKSIKNQLHSKTQSKGEEKFETVKKFLIKSLATLL